jgi:hypothetical protein
MAIDQQNHEKARFEIKNMYQFDENIWIVLLIVNYDFPDELFNKLKMYMVKKELIFKINFV